MKQYNFNYTTVIVRPDSTTGGETLEIKVI